MFEKADESRERVKTVGERFFKRSSLVVVRAGDANLGGQSQEQMQERKRLILSRIAGLVPGPGLRAGGDGGQRWGSLAGSGLVVGR